MNHFIDKRNNNTLTLNIALHGDATKMNKLNININLNTISEDKFIHTNNHHKQNTLKNNNPKIGKWIIDPHSLPESLDTSQVVVTKSRVYLLGGWADSTISTVYVASINEDGTIGSWNIDTNSLPGALHGSQAIITKNRVYLLGGCDGSNVVSTVYTAPIDEDGVIGSWTIDPNRLPEALCYSQSVVIKNRVYLLGGRNSFSDIISTIYVASINENGTLGSWTVDDNKLPEVLDTSQMIMTKNRVYLLGGRNSSSGIVSTIYTAPINKNGTIGQWDIDTNKLPEVLCYSQAIIVKNNVYLLGGWNGYDIVSSVYTAPINNNGTIGSWTKDPNNLSEALNTSQVISINNRIYLLGGNNGSTAISTVYTTTIN